MPLTSQWVPYYSNSFKTSGALLHIFPGNSNQPRHDVVPLTGNYGQYISPSTTFGTSLRTVNSPCLWTIRPKYTPSRQLLLDIPLGRINTLTLYPNLYRIYVTSTGVQIKLPMPYRVYRKFPSFQLKLYINFEQLAIAQCNDPDIFLPGVGSLQPAICLLVSYAQ